MEFRKEYKRYPRKLKKKYKKRGLLNPMLVRLLTTKDYEVYWTQHAGGILPVNNNGQE